MHNDVRLDLVLESLSHLGRSHSLTCRFYGQYPEERKSDKIGEKLTHLSFALLWSTSRAASALLVYLSFVFVSLEM